VGALHDPARSGRGFRCAEIQEDKIDKADKADKADTATLVLTQA
jgi:hypothetical protein